MPTLTPLQADELANQFLKLALAIGDFLDSHWNDLSEEERQQLARQHSSVLRYGEDILALSTILVMDDVSKSLLLVKEVTLQIRSALASLADVKKVIAVSAAIVTLGAAVISENPFAIGGALENLLTKWKAVS